MNKDWMLRSDSDDSSASSVPIAAFNLRAALADVSHRTLPWVVLFVGLDSLLFALQVGRSGDPGRWVTAWTLIGLALLLSAFAAVLHLRPPRIAWAHRIAFCLVLAAIVQGGFVLVRHPTFANGALVLATLPGIGFLVLETWAFAVAVALAVVVWASALARSLTGEIWVELELLVVMAVVVAAFIHVAWTRVLGRMAHFRLRERARRYRLKERFDSIDRHKEELAELSIRDPLTGAYNRRYVAQMQQELERPTAKWGCIMLDLDHFKRVNDRYGHEEGDRVLQGFAHFLRRVGRAEDQLIRYGGDEFLIFIDVRSEPELDKVSERLRALGSEESPAAFTLGKAFRRARESLWDVVSRADADMYLAKTRATEPRAPGSPGGVLR